MALPLKVCELVEKLRNKKCSDTQPLLFYSDVIDQSVVWFAKYHRQLFLDIQDWCTNTIVVFKKKGLRKTILFDGSQVILTTKTGQPRINNRTFIFMLDKNFNAYVLNF